MSHGHAGFCICHLFPHFHCQNKPCSCYFLMCLSFTISKDALRTVHSSCNYYFAYCRWACPNSCSLCVLQMSQLRLYLVYHPSICYLVTLSGYPYSNLWCISCSPLISLNHCVTKANLVSFDPQINGSLARRAIKDLMARGLIRMVSVHSSQQIYTRATNTWASFQALSSLEDLCFCYIKFGSVDVTIDVENVESFWDYGTILSSCCYPNF